MGEMKRQVTLQTSGVACTLKGGVGGKGKIGCARTMFSFLLLLRVPVLWTNRITLLFCSAVFHIGNQSHKISTFRSSRDFYHIPFPYKFYRLLPLDNLSGIK